MVEVEVTYEYEAEQNDELTIKVGDIIKNVKMAEGGWWEGELNGKSGMFPDNFVKVIDKAKEKEEHPPRKDLAKRGASVKELANKLKEVPIGTSAPRKKEASVKKKKAKVLFDYEPENEDELKIDTGDIVEITKQEEEGWWEGILNGKKGMFPSNFVEEIEDTDSDKMDKITEEKPKEPPEGQKKKIIGVGLGNIFAGGPINLRTSSGVKKEKEETKPPSEENTPVVKREKPAPMPKVTSPINKKALLASPANPCYSPVPDFHFHASNYVNSSNNIEDTNVVEPEATIDILSEIPQANESWLNVIYDSHESVEPSLSTTKKGLISNSYLTANDDIEALHQLSCLSNMNYISDDHLIEYVHDSEQDGIEENKENVALENVLDKMHISKSFPRVPSVDNKNNNNVVYDARFEVCENELGKLENSISQSLEAIKTSSEKSDDSHVPPCEKRVEEWLEEGKSSGTENVEDEDKEKHSIFVEMDYRKNLKSKKGKNSLLKRVMQLDFFKKKSKENRDHCKSSNEKVASGSSNIAAVQEGKSVEEKFNTTVQSRTPLKELNLDDFKLIDSDQSLSIEVSVDSSIGDVDEKQRAENDKVAQYPEEKAHNGDCNVSGHWKGLHQDTKDGPVKTVTETEKEILEEMEMNSAGSVYADEFQNSQEQNAALKDHDNEEMLEEDSLDVRDDSYLGFLRRTGHLSPFIRMIASRYHMFDVKDKKWKPCSTEIEQSQQDNSKDDDEPESSSLKYGIKSDVTPTKSIIQSPEIGINMTIKNNTVFEKVQDVERLDQEANDYSPERKQRKVSNNDSSVSPSWRVLPPGTVKETIQKYEHLFVSQLVENVLENAVQNLSVIEQIEKENALHEGRKDATPLTCRGVSDVDLSYESHFEESLYSAYTDNGFADADYTTAVSGFNTDQSYTLSAFSDSGTDTVNYDPGVGPKEFSVYTNTQCEQSDCYLDVSGQSEKPCIIVDDGRISGKDVDIALSGGKPYVHYFEDLLLQSNKDPWVSPVPSRQTVEAKIASRKRKIKERETANGRELLTGFSDGNAFRSVGEPSGRLSIGTQTPEIVCNDSSIDIRDISTDSTVQTEDRGTSPIKEFLYSMVESEENDETLNTSWPLTTPSKLKGKPRYSSSPIKNEDKGVDAQHLPVPQNEEEEEIRHSSAVADGPSQQQYAVKKLSTLASLAVENANFIKDCTEPRKKRSSWKRIFIKKKKDPVILLSYRKISDGPEPYDPVKNATAESTYNVDQYCATLNISQNQSCTSQPAAEHVNTTDKDGQIYTDDLDAEEAVDENVKDGSIYRQELDPALEYLNSVETYFSLRGDDDDDDDDDGDLEVEKKIICKETSKIGFKDYTYLCYPEILKPETSIVESSKFGLSSDRSGNTEDEIENKREEDMYSECECEYYSIADIENEMNEFENPDKLVNRGKCSRVVINQAFEHTSCEEDNTDDLSENISKDNSSSVSGYSEDIVEDSTDVSLDSPNISATVSKDLLRKIGLATSPNVSDAEGTPNLNKFLEEALKPIDDLLLNSSSENGGSEDDVTPTARRCSNSGTYISRWSTEKYPSFTYLSESLQDLLRQDAEEEQRRKCRRATFTIESREMKEITAAKTNQEFAFNLDPTMNEQNLTTSEESRHMYSGTISGASAVQQRERYPSFTYTANANKVTDNSSTSTEGDYDYQDSFESESETDGDASQTRQYQSSILSDGEIDLEMRASGPVNCHDDGSNLHIVNQGYLSLYRSDCVEDLSDPNSANESFTDDVYIRGDHGIENDHQNVAREQGDGLVNSSSLQDELYAALQGENLYTCLSRADHNSFDEEDPLQVSYSCCVDDPNDSVHV